MEPPVTVGIPNLTQLCLTKLYEMSRYQFDLCTQEKLSNTFNKIYGNQIFSSHVNVLHVASNDTVVCLYVLSQYYVSGGCFPDLITARLRSISVATKLTLVIVDNKNYCQYSTCVERPGRCKELVANVGSGTTGCLERLESTLVQGSADKALTSLTVSDDLSADWKSCTSQDGNQVVTSEYMDSRKMRSENENEDFMFDVSYLDRKERQIENEKDVSTSVLFYIKQGGKEMNNEVPVIEVDSVDSKKFETETIQDLMISDDIYLDIKQLKKNNENLMLLNIYDDVYARLLQPSTKVNSKVIKCETIFKSVTENLHKFTEDMDVKLHSYEAGRSDNNSVTTMHSGTRCRTGFGLSSRLHAAILHLQKLSCLYDSVQVCSPTDCCNQRLVCVFMQKSVCCYFILNIRRNKKRGSARTDIARISRTDIARISRTDIARTEFAAINKTDIGRISRTDIARIKGVDIARTEGVDLADINRTDIAENRKLIIYGNRAIAVVLLLSTNDILTSQKQLPGWPLANRNRILNALEVPVQDCLASLLLPENAEKTLVTRLGTFCSTRHEKNGCQQNNCQIVPPSSSSGSVIHTAKTTSEHNNVQELSSPSSSGSVIHTAKTTSEHNNVQELSSISPSSGSVIHSAKTTSEHNNVQELSSISSSSSGSVIHSAKTTSEHNNVQQLSSPSSSGSVIHTAKTSSEHNNVQELSSISPSSSGSVIHSAKTTSEHNNVQELSSISPSGSGSVIHTAKTTSEHNNVQELSSISSSSSGSVIHTAKTTSEHNNVQELSSPSSSGSVIHTAKTKSEHNNVQELSSICKFGSKQEMRFHVGKPNHGNAQLEYDSSDHILFSIKPLSGKRLSILLKNEHGRNAEGNMNILTVDVMGSISLKKIQMQTVEIEILDCFTPNQALKNVCVNMLPGSVCGIPWSEFERETMRLASFAKYPASAAKSPANLASCGFVYVGNGTSDRVKCYFCSVEKESWEMNDNIDEIHKSLRPTCPMVIVQFSNNVSSNGSSPAVGSVTGFSSSVPYSSESLRPMAVANAATTSLSAASGRDYSGYDDVDYRRTNAGSQPATELATPEPSSSQRETAVTSSLLAHTNRSINTLASTTAAPLTVPEMLQQDINSADRSNRINLGRQNSHNSDSLNEESARNQQNNGSAYQDNVSHHPNINTQVYAIPPDTNTTAAPSTSNSVRSNSQLTYQLLGIFHERPKFPNFAVLARRLQSFDGWPEHHPISKDDLVKSGLFFAGYGDCCKCFFCGGGLRNWENGDNAYVEHARWFDKCSYIRQFMGLEFVEAVQSLKTRGGTITFKDVTDYMQTQGQSIQNLFNDRKISDDVAVRSLIDARYNAEAVSRAAISLRESGELLSADLILRKMRDQESEINGTAGAVANDNTNSEEAHDEGRLQALKEQNYALRSNLTCKICMDKEVKIVFLPCGHLISCQECAVALQDCPLCRSHIRARARANIN